MPPRKNTKTKKPSPKSKTKAKNSVRKRPEDFIRKRKIRFALIRANKIFRIILLVIFLIIIVWSSFFGGYEVIRSAVRKVVAVTTNAIGLEVEEIEIVGNQVVSSEEIVNAVRTTTEFKEIPILLLDLEDLQRSITSVGWVNAAKIRIKLPSTLIVEVTERKPSFIWQSGGRIWLSDNKGNLISSKITAGNMELPVVVGNDAKDISELYSIVSTAPNLLDNVTGAKKVGNRRWDITLKKTIKVKLPEKDAIAAWKKLAELDRKNGLLSKTISYVDMRIENQVITGF